MTDFERLIRTLADERVEFIIISGLAATAHGSARLTQDIDVVYSRSSDNIHRLGVCPSHRDPCHDSDTLLVHALRSLKPYLRGAPPNLPFQWEEATVRRGLNFTLTTTAGDLDLLGEVTGGGNYEALLPHTVALSFFGCDCRCLDLPTLIRIKRAIGRPKDLEALAELEAIFEEREGASKHESS
ncbi:MAG: hypothetical protein HYS34_04440 [Acidobacteria bacterium]|nr:hypothetical protein [Acidobacteriota bacterium]